MHTEIFHQVSERLYRGFVLSSNILLICFSIFSFLIQQGEKPPLSLSLYWPKSSRTRVGYFLPQIHSFPPTCLTVNSSSHHVERLQHWLSVAKGKLLWVHLTQRLALSQGLQGRWRCLCCAASAAFPSMLGTAQTEARRQAVWGNPWVVQKRGLGSGASFSLQLQWTMLALVMDWWTETLDSKSLLCHVHFCSNVLRPLLLIRQRVALFPGALCCLQQKEIFYTQLFRQFWGSQPVRAA